MDRIVPILGSTIFGCGFVNPTPHGFSLYCQALMKVYSTRMLLVFSGVFTFLVDAYPLYS